MDKITEQQKKQAFLKRRKWFLSMVGKKVFLSMPTCKCNDCMKQHNEGVLIKSEEFAAFVHMLELNRHTHDFTSLYFETKEDRDAYDKKRSLTKLN